MALSENRLREIQKRLQERLLARHPGWREHIEFLVRYGRERKIDAPARLPDGVTPDTITGPQKTSLINALKNALADDADKALIDEVLG